MDIRPDYNLGTLEALLYPSNVSSFARLYECYTGLCDKPRDDTYARRDRLPCTSFLGWRGPRFNFATKERPYHLLLTF